MYYIHHNNDNDRLIYSLGARPPRLHLFSEPLIHRSHPFTFQHHKLYLVFAKKMCLCPTSQMEKYSSHLEVLVGERTADLEAEKLKTDRLLYSKCNVVNRAEPRRKGM